MAARGEGGRAEPDFVGGDHKVRPHVLELVQLGAGDEPAGGGAPIRVTRCKAVTTSLFSPNVHKSGVVGSGLASKAQNCPLFETARRSGCRAIATFVPLDQRGPHVCLHSPRNAFRATRNAQRTHCTFNRWSVSENIQRQFWYAPMNGVHVWPLGKSESLEKLFLCGLG